MRCLKIPHSNETKSTSGIQHFHLEYRFTYMEIVFTSLNFNATFILFKLAIKITWLFIFALYSAIHSYYETQSGNHFLILYKKSFWILRVTWILRYMGNDETFQVAEMRFDKLFIVDSLGLSDAIWRQGSGSILAQVMVCCLTAPSHYLIQCWLIISKVQWHSSRDNFTRDTSDINHWNYLKN